MDFSEPHRWDVTPAEARQIQVDLAGRVERAGAVMAERVRLVAGIDNGYVQSGETTTGVAAVVVLTMPGLDVVETRLASCPVPFPYVPGLLSFREGPAILAACRQVVAEPDVILFDGQGIAHPHRLGLAAHLGVILDRPTIGCAKSRLVGSWEEPPRVFGAWSPLVDRGEFVGAALRTRPRHRPLFVSTGNRIDLESAIAVVLACCRDGHFLPEPTRLAHEAVTAATRQLPATDDTPAGGASGTC
jgi:deoxyribonuclease V